jgi:DNA-binding PadR family transcriptional regulator
LRVAWNRNAEKVISAALAVERLKGRRPWTAADLISYLDEEDGAAKPSDATVYRLLHRFDVQLGLLASVMEEPEDGRLPGRPRRIYELTPAGLDAASSAASWLSHGGIQWARVIVADYRP